jgi:CheY-like chemotaxis protein
VTPPAHPAARTVAVVDDDSTCTVVLDRILSRAGYRVAVFTSGEDVLAAVASEPVPDAVCLDLSLPGIDGMETLRRLKALVPSLPVIVFTAAADERASDVLAAGGFACVAKAAWATLTDEIRRAIPGQHRH